MLSGLLGEEKEWEFVFTLNPSAKVNTLDLTRGDVTVSAIYEVDGDLLKVCMANKPNSPRPEEFKADRSQSVTVKTYKRVKDETKHE